MSSHQEAYLGMSLKLTMAVIVCAALAFAAGSLLAGV
jgi:hypothetical protein